MLLQPLLLGLRGLGLLGKVRPDLAGCRRVCPQECVCQGRAALRHFLVLIPVSQAAAFWPLDQVDVAVSASLVVKLQLCMQLGS